jgi:AcrR family transcriptional regulator
VVKTAAKKRTRLNKETSREMIIKETLNLISKIGWEGLSFPTIAKHCKMSPSNIIYHFESRETLLVALLGHISVNNFRVVADSMKPEFDSFQRILIHFQKNLEWGRLFPQEAQVVLQIYAQAPYDKRFSEIFDTMIEKAQARICEHLLSGQREGLFHFELEPMKMAKFLHNILVGSFINVMGGRLGIKFEYPDAEWEAVLKRLLGYQKRSG